MEVSDEDLEITDADLKETLDTMSASELLELSEELDIQAVVTDFPKCFRFASCFIKLRARIYLKILLGDFLTLIVNKNLH